MLLQGMKVHSNQHKILISLRVSNFKNLVNLLTDLFLYSQK